MRKIVPDDRRIEPMPAKLALRVSEDGDILVIACAKHRVRVDVGHSHVEGILRLQRP